MAAGSSVASVVLSRLRLRSAGCALLLAGGCSVERCEVLGGSVGIEVTKQRQVRILRCVVRHCEVGISLAGASAALEGTHVERCKCGLSLTGLDVEALYLHLECLAHRRAGATSCSPCPRPLWP